MIVLLLIVLFYPVTSSASTQNLTLLSPRWLSIPELHPPLNPAYAGWGPWPRVCTGTPEMRAPVRYCWRDQRSYGNLGDTLNHAIAKWAPAAIHSSLDIALDFQGDEKTAARDAYTVYCNDPRVKDDALVIWDESKDGDDEFNWEQCDTKATTGYEYGSQVRGRHTLQFCDLVPGYEDPTKDKAIRAMMHELGHVIGLQHEHQRDDRDKYLNFVCANLEGYAAGVQAADADEDVLFEDDDDEKYRINAICLDETFAIPYLPASIPFLKSAHMDSPRWRKYTSSPSFDYDSIMIYDSSSGSIDSTNDQKWVLVRKDNAGPVWMGGNKDAGQAKLSALDIQRVAMLYPKDDGIQVKRYKMEFENVTWHVKIGSNFETVLGPALLPSTR